MNKKTIFSITAGTIAAVLMTTAIAAWANSAETEFNKDKSFNLGSENNPYTILEVVPDKAYAEIGYLVGGEEPVNLNSLISENIITLDDLNKVVTAVNNTSIINGEKEAGLIITETAGTENFTTLEEQNAKGIENNVPGYYENVGEGNGSWNAVYSEASATGYFGKSWLDNSGDDFPYVYVNDLSAYVLIDEENRLVYYRLKEDGTYSSYEDDIAAGVDTEQYDYAYKSYFNNGEKIYLMASKASTDTYKKEEDMPVISKFVYAGARNGSWEFRPAFSSKKYSYNNATSTWKQAGNGQTDYALKWLNIKNKNIDMGLGTRASAYASATLTEERLTKLEFKNSEFFKQKVLEENANYKVRVLSKTPSEITENDIDSADMIYFNAGGGTASYRYKNIVELYKLANKKPASWRPDNQYLGTEERQEYKTDELNSLMSRIFSRVLLGSSEIKRDGDDYEIEYEGDKPVVIFDSALYQYASSYSDTFLKHLDDIEKLTLESTEYSSENVAGKEENVYGYENAITKLYIILNEMYPVTYYKHYVKPEMTVRDKNINIQYLSMPTAYMNGEKITKGSYISALNKRLLWPADIYGKYGIMANYSLMGIDNPNLSADYLCEHHVLSFNSVSDNNFLSLFDNKKINNIATTAEAFDVLRDNEIIEEERTQINGAEALKYLIKHHTENKITKKSLAILDIEPCNDFVTEPAWAWKMCGLAPYYLGRLENFNMPGSQMSTRHFIGINSDLSNDYDMIYIGSNTGAMAKKVSSKSSLIMNESYDMTIRKGETKVIAISDLAAYLEDFPYSAVDLEETVGECTSFEVKNNMLEVTGLKEGIEDIDVNVTLKSTTTEELSATINVKVYVESDPGDVDVTEYITIPVKLSFNKRPSSDAYAKVKIAGGRQEKIVVLNTSTVASSVSVPRTDAAGRPIEYRVSINEFGGTNVKNMITDVNTFMGNQESVTINALGEIKTYADIVGFSSADIGLAASWDGTGGVDYWSIVTYNLNQASDESGTDSWNYLLGARRILSPLITMDSIVRNVEIEDEDGEPITYVISFVASNIPDSLTLTVDGYGCEATLLDDYKILIKNITEKNPVIQFNLRSNINPVGISRVGADGDENKNIYEVELINEPQGAITDFTAEMYYLSSYNNGNRKYATNIQLTDSPMGPKKTGAKAEAAPYGFEVSQEDSSKYYIYTYINDVKNYVKFTAYGNNAHMFFTQDDPSSFDIVKDGPTDISYAISTYVDGKKYWLNQKGSVNGNRYDGYYLNDAGSKIDLVQATFGFDPLEIDGNEYVIVNTNKLTALMNTPYSSLGLKASADGLITRQTVEGVDRFETDIATDLSVWRFEAQDDGSYYISSDVQGTTMYLNISEYNSNANSRWAGVSETPQKIVIGVKEGQIRLQHATDIKNSAINLRNPTNNTTRHFSTYNDNGVNEWFTLGRAVAINENDLIHEIKEEINVVKTFYSGDVFADYSGTGDGNGLMVRYMDYVSSTTMNIMTNQVTVKSGNPDIVIDKPNGKFYIKSKNQSGKYEVSVDIAYGSRLNPHRIHSIVNFTIYELYDENRVTEDIEVTAYNDSNMEGLLYTHLGDTWEFVANSSNRNYYDGAVLKDGRSDMGTGNMHALANGRYQTRLSGNDITKRKFDELQAFVNSDLPVFISDKLVVIKNGAIANANENTVDNSSYLYEFIENNKDSLLFESQNVSNIWDDAFLKSIDIDVITSPAIYNEEDGVDDSDYLEDRILNFELGVNTRIGGDTNRYAIEMYIDANADNIFSEDEELKNVTVKTNAGNVVNSERISANVSGRTYLIEKAVPAQYCGVVSWKLVVCNARDRSIYRSIEGISALRTASINRPNIIALQLKPKYSAYTTTLNLDATRYFYDKSTRKEKTFYDNLEYVNDFNIHMLTASEFRLLDEEGKVKDIFAYKVNTTIYKDHFGGEVVEGTLIPDEAPTFSIVEYVENDAGTKLVDSANSIASEINDDGTAVGVPIKYRSGVSVITPEEADASGVDHLSRLGTVSDMVNIEVDGTINGESGHYVVNRFVQGVGFEEIFDYDNGVENTGTTPEVINVNMVITGFGDMQVFTGNDNLINAIANHIQQGRTVFFTHDTFYTARVPSNGWLAYNTAKFTNAMQNFGAINRFSEDPGWLPGSNRTRTDSTVLQGWSDITAIGHITRTARVVEGYVPFYSLGTRKNSAGHVMYSNNTDLTTGRTDWVEIVNRGQFTEYPFHLPDKMKVSLTHYQYWQLNLEDDLSVWMTLHVPTKGYENFNKDTRNNYYIYSKENVVYCGTGHAGDYTNEELRLFVNTIVSSYRNDTVGTSIVINDNESVINGNDTYIYIDEDYDALRPEADLSELKERKLKFNVIDNNLISNSTIDIKFAALKDENTTETVTPKNYDELTDTILDSETSDINIYKYFDNEEPEQVTRNDEGLYEVEPRYNYYLNIPDNIIKWASAKAIASENSSFVVYVKLKMSYSTRIDSDDEQFMKNIETVQRIVFIQRDIFLLD